MSLGNQLESVPPYDITSNKCCIQGKHKSTSLDTSVTHMVTEGSSPITSVNRSNTLTRLILVCGPMYVVVDSHTPLCVRCVAITHKNETIW